MLFKTSVLIQQKVENEIIPAQLYGMSIIFGVCCTLLWNHPSIRQTLILQGLAWPNVAMLAGMWQCWRECGNASGNVL
jgi:hypothetical protein